MRFVYIDTGLASNVGHHANSCRHITGELRRRGIHTEIYAHSAIVPELKQELNAIAHFKHDTYTTRYPESSGYWDPVCGWLRDFDKIWQSNRDDLRKIAVDGESTLVYMSSVWPAQFMAAIQWLRSFSVAQRPTVVTEFGTSPGLQLRDGQFHAPLPHEDSRPFLYRYSVLGLRPEEHRFIKPVTFDANSAAVYQFFLNMPFTALPLPFEATTTRRNRSGARPITVSFLGHQRGEKGYHLLPALLPMLLDQRPDIRVLVHNGHPGHMPAEHEAMRRIAAGEPRIEMNELPADAELWRKLLEQSDLIVCPYDPAAFLAGYSAVATEAIANGIPFVASAVTTLETLLRQFGSPGCVFERWTAASVCSAVVRAIDNFDNIAGIAHQASAKWARERGPAQLVDALLACYPAAKAPEMEPVLSR